LPFADRKAAFPKSESKGEKKRVNKAIDFFTGPGNIGPVAWGGYWGKKIHMEDCGIDALWEMGKEKKKKSRSNGERRPSKGIKARQEKKDG